ncbi:fibronectin type III domain-containing protein [Actinoplanes hulinensis]|uniref:Fibronectin type III domain-containing protein n=1 Tax=Actinoplanes hulinensis TaxID=1144547 RepID=A0ABS7AZJ6_9ACTN|nr:fibronectin type III domain-containing protein [Actinoplanes hulinensis]MBW6433821.1 fibronectin type III domain-containing protein [Actinoplanes hulinensis]
MSLLAVTAVTGTRAAPALAAPPSGGMSGASVEAMFAGYSAGDEKWAAGDGTASVLLPDNRILWLFSETLIGPVAEDWSVPAETPLVKNTAVVQDGSALVETLTGGAAGAPESLIPAPAADEFYRIGDAVVEGDTVKAVYQRKKQTGEGPLDFEHVGTALVTFSLPDLTVADVAPLSLGGDIAWGASILPDGDHTYIYGTEGGDDSDIQFAHLARVPAGNIGGAWQFWTGSGWSSQESASVRLLSGVQSAFGTLRHGDQYVVVTGDSHLPFDPWFVAYTATSPAGPFTGPIPLHQAPEPTAGENLLHVSGARLHPDLARAGKLLMSYAVGGFHPDDVYADVRNGRPRFVEVDWPRPAPGDVPAAPTGLAATADAEGRVTLGWTAPSGSGLSYWVHRRDLTAGQTHFAREVSAVTGTSMTPDRLIDQHTYEFKVTAAGAGGEGAASAVITTAVRVLEPPAPEEVSAEADKIGTATVSWEPVAGAEEYDVAMRDITAGETTLLPVDTVEAGQTELAVEALDDAHQYEFAVTASNTAGESDTSETARVDVALEVPDAPSGVTAGPLSDGTIHLNWDHAAEDDWFYVYQRDVTAEEPEFTRLELPVTAGSEMTAGYLVPNHEYEYKIGAVNRLGESDTSPVVEATATLAPPSAPINLTVTADDGAADLSWTGAENPNVWYVVEMRNVSDEEPGFTRLPDPVTTCCTMRAGLLTNGDTYEFRVAAIDGGGGESGFSNAATVKPLPPPPGQVTGLTATPLGNGDIQLAWTSQGPDLWYYVQTKDVTAGETVFKQLALPVTVCCSMTAGYLTTGHIYHYRVLAVSPVGAGSGPVSATVAATSTVQRPGAPTGLQGVSSGPGNVDLTWTPPAPNLYYYAYWRNVTTGQTTFSRSEYPVSTPYASLGYLAGGSQYEFKVTAANSAGEGAFSGTIRVNVLSALPNPAGGLTATAGDAKVTLRWTASSTAGVLYNVWMRDVTANSSFRKLDLPVSGTTMIAGYLTNDHLYEFYVTATNSAGDSPASNKVTARPFPPIPQPPTGLTATAGNGQVVLNWTASSTVNVYYWVEMRSKGGKWKRLKSPVTTCCSFTAGYLGNGTRYEFRMYSFNVAGVSANPSGVASATPLPPAATAPSNLTAFSGAGKVSLSWSASPTANVWYWVYQREAKGSWRKLPIPVTRCCTFTPGNLVNGRIYEFKVTAFNERNESGASNTVSTRPSVTLTRAPILNGAATSTSSVELWWTATPNATGYWVEYADISANPNAGWTKISTPVLGTTFKGGYLGAGKWYRWRVTPSNGDVLGPVSPPLEIRTRGQVHYSGRYHLGDSFSAGVGAGYETGGDCLRSPLAWPLLLNYASSMARHLACTGAEVPDMRSGQLPGIGQPGPTLITLTIGGNDVGFADELTDCILGTSSCTGREAVINRAIDNYAVTLRNTYREIRAIAPGADIVVAGYPLLLTPPGVGNCNAIFDAGLSDAERRMIRRLGTRMNGVIRQSATEAGAIPVITELSSEFAGHEACSTNGEYINQITARWSHKEGAMHPNAAGHRAYQRAVTTRLGQIHQRGMVRY